jgi:glycosyltransferase involved in cell wall biosynthesis
MVPSATDSSANGQNHDRPFGIDIPHTKSEMKICILQGAFFPVPPLLGGAVEKMWFQLGIEFAKLGHEVCQVSRNFKGLPNEEIIAGVRHFRVDGYHQPKLLTWLKILDALYTFRACRRVPLDADVVVTNTFWAPLLVSSRSGRLLYPDIARMPRGQCRFYASAGRLRANSTPVATAIRSELPSQEHHRVSLIPNPLPFTPPEGNPLPDKRPIILYCGRVHPEKGLDLLVRAVDDVPPEWEVRIVGPWETAQGGGGAGYVRELQSLPSGKRVTFVGPVYDPEELSTHYRAAALFCYPSVAEKGETFGLAPLEAMAWGCVPVVSDLECFKDFISDQGNGRVFDHRVPNAPAQLQKILQELTADSFQRQRLAEEALLVRQSHAPARIAQMFLADFESALASRLPRQPIP